MKVESIIIHLTVDEYIIHEHMCHAYLGSNNRFISPLIVHQCTE